MTGTKRRKASERLMLRGRKCDAIKERGTEKRNWKKRKWGKEENEVLGRMEMERRKMRVEGIKKCSKMRIYGFGSH